MSDQPRRRLKPAADDLGYEVIDGPDAGYEVVDPPPTATSKPPAPKLAVAKRAVPKPPPPEDADDWDDEEDDRPRKKKKPAAEKSWVERYVVNVRGAILFAVLVGVITAMRGAMWLKQEFGGPPAPPPAPPPSTLVSPGAPSRPFTSPKLPAGWQEYTDHLGTFVACVPEGATISSLDLSGATRRLPPGSPPPRGVKWDKGSVTYMLTISTLPPDSARPTDPKAADQRDADAAKVMLSSFTSSAGLVPDNFIIGQGRGSETVLLGGKRGAGGTFTTFNRDQTLVVQAVVADGVGYVAVVSGVSGGSNPQAVPFFDGFRLTPGASPPPGATAPPMATAPPPPAAVTPPTNPGTRPPSPTRGRKRP